MAALGEDAVLEMYREKEIPEIAENKLASLFRLYSFVGGMPEVVARYVETEDMSQLNPVYESLITSYKDDVSKYAKNATEANVIRHVIETAPFETGKRIKFERFGNSNYKSKEIGEALKILERAMFLYLRYPVNGHELPLVPNFKQHPRLQFLDTGLLNYALGLSSVYYKDVQLSDAYNGMIAEHVVGQELLASQSVEVKSGATGSLRSLHSYIDEGGFEVALRLYSGKKSVENAVTPQGRKPYKLVNLPLYYAGKLGEFQY